MDAYAVLKGGGVKGAAFAGGLAAAEEHGINFAGYGGASAGSIVAFLAALGYSGNELLEIMQKINFQSLVAASDVDGKPSLPTDVDWDTKLVEPLLRKDPEPELEGILRETKEFKDEFKANGTDELPLVGSIKKGLWIFSKGWLLKRWKNLLNVLPRLIKNKGAFDTRNLISQLSYYVVDKFGDSVFSECPVTQDLCLPFSKFYALTNKDLKVISTDLETGRTVVFSRIDTPDECVFQAIAASSTFPFLYKPSSIGDTFLVDGGLSCNLPTHLFNSSEYKNLPIFAFDLYKDKSNLSREVNIRDAGVISFAYSMIEAAMEASDHIINNVVDGIRVPVEVPEDIGTLDFILTNQQIQNLYTTGYNSAFSSLANHPFKLYLKGSRDPRDYAKLMFGHCHQPILKALSQAIHITDSIDELKGKHHVKSWLYTCIKADESEIISFDKYSTQEINHHKFALDQNANNDCVKAWLTKQETFTYIEDPKQPKCRVCFPIRKNSSLRLLEHDGQKAYTGNVIGVLCVCIDCPIELSGWFDKKSANNEYDLSVSFVNAILPYIDIIEKTMLGAQASLTFKE
ncbi:patatin-like phospholipase family protein [Vibrio splendidus]